MHVYVAAWLILKFDEINGGVQFIRRFVVLVRVQKSNMVED